MKMTSFAAALAVAVGCVAHAQAQTYPSRPVTMIVPFPAGGPTDTLARILSERMKGSLGQPVIVENVTGAGASIGVARVAQAAPDGYTLNIGNWTSHVGAGAMYPAVHDALLERARRHLIAAGRCMAEGDTAGVARHADTAELCIREAQEHDAAEDTHVGVMVLLVVKVRDLLRLRNGLLDGLLIVRKRRPAKARQMALIEVGS